MLQLVISLQERVRLSCGEPFSVDYQLYVVCAQT